MKKSKSSAAETRARAGNVGYRRGAGAWRGTLGAANTGARRPTGENALTPCVSASAAGYKGRYIASPRARSPGAPRAWPCERMCRRPAAAHGAPCAPRALGRPARCSLKEQRPPRERGGELPSHL